MVGMHCIILNRRMISYYLKFDEYSNLQAIEATDGNAIVSIYLRKIRSS